jgi:hypothetical protein
MNVPLLLMPRILARPQGPAEAQPERVEAFPSQEQSTDIIPLRNERPAADIFSERLTASDPASPTLVFVP